MRPSLVRRAWLWSGLVLFSYVASHLVNHALGLMSLEAMETGRDWFLLVWRHPVGTVALYGALSAHMVLALSSLYQRRHFRLPAWEALQLLLGLAIPPLLISHIVGTRHARRRQVIRITYPDGRAVVVPVGLTVLEASRHARIPHASVCGGRGRCSTCRIRVVRGLEFLPPGSAEERRVLTSVGAPPNVRLACQVRPTRDLSMIPLLPAEAQASDGFAQPGYLAGHEQEITVLFADLRGFTRIY